MSSYTPICIIFRNKRRFQDVPFGHLHLRGAGVKRGQQLEVGAGDAPGGPVALAVGRAMLRVQGSVHHRYEEDNTRWIEHLQRPFGPCVDRQ